jgi:hypothetical protein
MMIVASPRSMFCPSDANRLAPSRRLIGARASDGSPGSTAPSIASFVGWIHLKKGGTLEQAAAMVNHASTRTTQLYDRRHDEVSLDEVERIVI